MSELNIQATPEVVEPGSSNDPFSKNYVAPSEESPASPAVAVPTRGVTATVPADVPNPNEPASTPTPAVATATPEASPVPEADNTGASSKAPDVEALIREAAETARREAQSAADKRIAAIEKTLKDAQEASRKAEREAKLKDEYLSDDEKERLRTTWELEDRKVELDAYHNELEDYYRSMLVDKLSRDYGQFGVTASELAAITDADEMERYVERKELEFHRSGKTVQTPAATVPAPAVVANEPPAPAGASAPTHVGGVAPAPEQPKFDTGQGWTSLATNLKNLPESSVAVPN
jgi:hypothetical protein